MVYIPRHPKLSSHTESVFGGVWTNPQESLFASGDVKDFGGSNTQKTHHVVLDV